jgi:hypothetical protein
MLQVGHLHFGETALITRMPRQLVAGDLRRAYFFVSLNAVTATQSSYLKVKIGVLLDLDERFRLGSCYIITAHARAAVEFCFEPRFRAQLAEPPRLGASPSRWLTGQMKDFLGSIYTLYQCLRRNIVYSSHLIGCTIKKGQETSSARVISRKSLEHRNFRVQSPFCS